MATYNSATTNVTIWVNGASVLSINGPKILFPNMFAPVLMGDRYWRQRDVTDDAPMFFGHDGKRQFVGGTQGAHDELLGVAGVWCISERGDGHGLDGGNVVRGFVSELEGHGLVFDCFLKI